jgi:DNA/RNA-binding domain of Phe-tRNA-synthetase-like protein
MADFCISARVFEKLPDVCFGAVVAKGIDNTAEHSDVSDFLNHEVHAIRSEMSAANLREHPAILPYREAFLQLGVNPNKFMCSVEALSKRVLKGSPIPSINPIVDIGNAMSLKYILPIGAHDIGKMNGENLEVRFARNGDHFLPFGETEMETPDENELVYVCGSTIKTRRWIWRQSEDGKIDADSTDVIFPIDGFTNRNLETVLAAQKILAAFLKDCFGCVTKTALLNQDNLSVSL